MFRNIITAISVTLIAAALVIFLVTMSQYPVGDDPGFTTSMLRSIVEQGKLRAEVPFFPQLHQVYGEGRVVTLGILAIIARVFSIQDIFMLPTYFAIGCIGASLILIFLITMTWLESRAAALFSVLFLAFNKWFQANFWEGSYEQYTGLLVLVAMIYCLMLWQKKKSRKFLVLSGLLLGLLYFTHQLGFLIGATVFMTTFFFYFRTFFRTKYTVLMTSLAVVAVATLFYLLSPGYFAVNTVGYPIPAMLSSSEGTPYLLLLVFIVAVVLILFQKKNIILMSWLFISLIFSQSMLIGVPFYAYRFNVYFIVALAVISGIVVQYVQQHVKNPLRPAMAYMLLCLAALVQFIVVDEFNYIHGIAAWVSGQKNNPSSVILDQDVAAFRWLGDNSDKSAVAVAPFKWGYYLPALSGRKVILDTAVGGDARDARYPYAVKAQKMFATVSSQEASGLAKDLEASYVVWD
ncbi:MAG: hypothetical protein WCT27_04660, partial [Patescibacteria group bacterium]